MSVKSFDDLATRVPDFGILLYSRNEKFDVENFELCVHSHYYDKITHVCIDQ